LHLVAQTLIERLFRRRPLDRRLGRSSLDGELGRRTLDQPCLGWRAVDRRPLDGVPLDQRPVGCRRKLVLTGTYREDYSAVRRFTANTCAWSALDARHHDALDEVLLSHEE
jgi:hypothetical protein